MIVFDDQHRASTRLLVEQGEQFIGIAPRQAGRRFVEQHQTRRAGKRQSQVEQAALRMRQSGRECIALVGQAPARGQCTHCFVMRVERRRPQRKCTGHGTPALHWHGPQLDGGRQLRADRMAAEHARQLPAAHDTEPRARRHGQAIEHHRIGLHATGVSALGAGDEIEQGRFAGAVRAAEPAARAGREIEIDTVEHRDRAEALDDTLQHEMQAGHAAPLRQ